MSVMVQIRNVPDSVHRRLKAQAAMAGMTLSNYLLDEMRKVAERPTIDEIRKRIESREPVTPPISSVDIIRAERDRR